LVAFAYPESSKKLEAFLNMVASLSRQKLQKSHLVLKVDKLPQSSFSSFFQKAFQELLLEKLQLIETEPSFFSVSTKLTQSCFL
jgi:hypothetical protein